jgi:hypothetical protein
MPAVCYLFSQKFKTDNTKYTAIKISIWATEIKGILLFHKPQKLYQDPVYKTWSSARLLYQICVIWYQVLIVTRSETVGVV